MPQQQKLKRPPKPHRRTTLSRNFPTATTRNWANAASTSRAGKKQRIAIARALITRPKVLILDDSTSAVDFATEAHIHRALDEWAAGSTRFLVAQRISTVLEADKILLLDNGRLVAQGTHRELLAASPIYREIYDSQL